MNQISAAGHRLEYFWIGPGPTRAPTLVFLHEGLGCAAMWRDFPRRLADATGCGALVYSRWGYGGSDAAPLERSRRYLHDEALEALPDVLEATGVREAILVGHSDGAAIAVIYAGGHVDRSTRLMGVVLEAPHVFVEEKALIGLTAVADAYRQGELRRKLERWHGSNTDAVFFGLGRVWLDEAFRTWNIESFLGHIGTPVLVIQGEDDEFGTMAQVEAIEAGCKEEVKRVVLAGCRHCPHLDQPEATLASIVDFVTELRSPGTPRST